VREEEEPTLRLETLPQRRNRAPAMKRGPAELDGVQLAPVHIAAVDAGQDAPARREDIAHPLLHRIARFAIGKGEGGNRRFMAGFRQRHQVFADVALDAVEARLRAVEMRMRVGADLMAARVDFSQRCGVEHLAQHRAAQPHESGAGIEAGPSAMFLDNIGAIEGGLREIVEGKGHHRTIRRNLRAVGLAPHRDAPLHLGGQGARWGVAPLHS